MDFGVMFFAGSDRPDATGRYELLYDAARFADANGFCAVWTPERHFNPFGGLFPNPSVPAAALAAITTRVQIRAGSVIAPLHDPIRIAEEWAVVDNMSDGRVAISFGSGWNANDFVLQPDRYEGRQARMYEAIDVIARLWRGEAIARTNGAGRTVEVRVHPRPVQPQLPVWVTSSGNADTFASAGAIGANLLTHLLGQTVETLAGKIRRYRQARRERGFDPDTGRVAVMLHTFIGDDLQQVERIVKAPFCEYLRSAVRLEERAVAAGGAISGGHRVEQHTVAPEALQDLTDAAYERYLHTASLLGTPDTARAMVSRLEEIEVDEIACLVDFGPADAEVMRSLRALAPVVADCSRDVRDLARRAALLDFTTPLV